MEEASNKKGQQLSITTLILIVIGIIVLVLVVLGFSIGWQNLYGKIGIASGSDFSAMVAACRVAVASDSKASYCEFKKVNLGGDLKSGEINCEYEAVADDLDDKLSDCGKSVTDQYSTKGLKKTDAE